MSDDEVLGTKDKLEVLIQRYGQLKDLNEHKNKVIYRIFYLSVVFVGVAIGGYNAVQSKEAKILLTGFVSLVFLSMLLWTRTYHNSRIEIHSRTDTVYEEIAQLNIELSPETMTEDLLRNHDITKKPERDFWESSQSFKDRLLQFYYIALFVTSSAFTYLTI
jgi:hypothetical protein